MAALVARNENQAIVAAVLRSGEVCVWLGSGIGKSFCVGAFGTNMLSGVVKTFSHLICFMKTFYESLFFQCCFHT
jgi:hypothetical protein